MFGPVCAALAQIKLAQIIIGLTTQVYIHLIKCGLGPHVDLAILAILARSLLPLAILSLI